MAELDIFRIADDTELTASELVKYIHKNDSKTNTRYRNLWKAYTNDYKIFHMPKKPEWKPDNRISANFAQYIVETFEGFFLGVPVKVTSDDETVDAYVNDVDDMTDSDDINAELSTIVSIFGRGYRIIYVDEDGEIGSAYLDPMDAFAIYNDSITPKMRYFCRTYKDAKNVRRGSVADDVSIKYFHLEGGTLKWDEEYQHGFDGVPAVEFVQNRARIGIFEPVMSLIDEYNKLLSEKANDSDAMSDSYMKILGAKVDEATIKFMRDNRIINLAGKAATDVVVDFISKPSADTSQEHLLDRAERLIFTIAMVCNISDDNFATSSGIALKYKMLPMINLAAKKWRKFANGLNRYYKLMCSNPVTPLKEDDWKTLKYTHLLNYPVNIADEAATAAALSGITSRKTQLSVLSIVDDVNEEMEQIKQEAEEAADFATQLETARTEGGEANAEEADRSVPEETV